MQFDVQFHQHSNGLEKRLIGDEVVHDRDHTHRIRGEYACDCFLGSRHCSIEDDDDRKTDRRSRLTLSLTGAVKRHCDDVR